MRTDVLVVIGLGGIGRAVAGRCGAGRPIVPADRDPTALRSLERELGEQGHAVTTHPVDITDRAQVREPARAASEVGAVSAVVHTAGVSPTQAAPEQIFTVDSSTRSTAPPSRPWSRVHRCDASGLPPISPRSPTSCSATTLDTSPAQTFSSTAASSPP
ncbi:SDR family NAD(P)-dependent oxidoreductase [Nocardia sp. NEAU-351]|uniref:SDR family NAD(P)-dependent oxidoreductase n=1 Tax=Nocardia bovistercoris TaxID=2785916 RepID=A0A931IHV5_9NOCA|nr:SDR family NAD(P)-dependent oxidoreductase [Nocardia bovistercoris]